ncbi:MAG: protein-tyrosine kinase [Acidobacteriota bacterium]|jgi:capsular exopolysaccharide synthesis family protein
MSRIQDILSKAERDGNTRRTRGLSDEGQMSPPVAVAPRPPQQPAYEPAAAGHSWTPAATATAIEPEHTVTGSRLDPHLVAALAPQSLAAEQYRSLRTRIKRAENGRALRSIVVTSPNKGDGKSLTAANLAITMAQEFQQRVLLIDGDLRRPAVHTLFGIPEGPGLTDVLMGGAELNQALVNVEHHHLTVLPAGAIPSHPAELLGSASMRRVLDTLRTRFDRILIDMPPVAPLADLHIVAPMVDGLLMIIRAGVTPRPAIERALAGLDTQKVLGLVLNESGGNVADTAMYHDYGYVAG